MSKKLPYLAKRLRKVSALSSLLDDQLRPQQNAYSSSCVLAYDIFQLYFQSRANFGENVDDLSTAISVTSSISFFYPGFGILQNPSSDLQMHCTKHCLNASEFLRYRPLHNSFALKTLQAVSAVSCFPLQL